MLRMVLFDLDGTLLPMNMDQFTKGYFVYLARKLAPYGYEAKKLVDGIWRGLAAMVRNDGTKTNEEAFWDCFVTIFGEKVRNDKYLFEEFYANEFNLAKDLCGYNPKAKELVNDLKASGIRVALATNPIFPFVATRNRLNWVDLKPSDFEEVSTYEQYHYSKPNPRYYAEFMGNLTDIDPKDCLMVGNDVEEDTAAQQLGMKVFLLTDTMENKHNLDYSAVPHGSYEELRAYIESLRTEPAA